MYHSYQNPVTDEERYLRDENERLRREAEETRDRQHEAREERLREMREAGERYQRSADSWPEALQKQIYLFGREVDEFDTDHYFGDGVEACKRALVIWREVESGKAQEIAELEARIEALRESVRTEVSERLMTEAEGRPGWRGVAQSITEEDFNRWLDW